MRLPIIAYIICFILTTICVFVQSFGSPITDIAWFCAVFSLIALPLLDVRRIHPRDEADAGILITLKLKEILIGIAIVALLFIPVAFGNHILRTEFMGQALHFSWNNYARLDSPVYMQALIQLIGVALPEEFFYRGYLQTAFLKHFSASSKLKKFAPALAISLASALFALAHFPSGGPARLLTFFPGLMFGLIRHKTNGLAASIICHAACNMMMIVLNVHYF